MEEIIVANLTLDTYQRNKVAPLVVPQGDYGARVIRAKITDLGKPVIVESTAAVSIVATRSGDGESQAFSGSVNADGTVTVPVTQWMLDVPEEDVTCHIVVTGIGYQYSTTSFLIEPQEKANPTEIAPDDPRQDLVTEVLAGENTRRAAEAERVSNENTRIAAENARQSAEEQRLTDESTRTTNEAQRVSAEASRDATFKSWAQDIASLPTFDGRISANRKRIENLESGIPAESFIIDDSVAYTKDVPENIAPNAVVQKVGGMTYKDGDTLRSAKVTAVKSVGRNLIPFPYIDTTKTAGGVTFTLNADRSITFSGDATGGNDFALGVVPIKQGESYALSIAGSASNIHYQIRFIDASGTAIGIETIESGKLNLVVTPDQIPTEAVAMSIHLKRLVNGVVSGTIYPMCNPGTTAKPYTPYVKHILPIPEELRPANGINENVYDSIEWAEDGSVKKTVKCGVVDLGEQQWNKAATSEFYADIDDNIVATWEGYACLCAKYTRAEQPTVVNNGEMVLATKNQSGTAGRLFIVDSAYTDAAAFKAAMSGVMLVYELAEPIITDISDLITADNLVPVQSGGTMTPVNEYGYAVPSTIIYQSR